MVLLVRKDMDVNEHDEYELKAPSWLFIDWGTWLQVLLDCSVNKPHHGKEQGTNEH
jgi:hypothetical protein